jgi:aminoglycoside phosphotransferase family enzyme/predicted kinase
MSPIDLPAGPARPPATGRALIEALMRPERYPHPVERIDLVETHLSWVFLTGSYAYKIKKPLDLGFADFSTLERRHHCCREELRLNARYAPDLYLEVVTIRDTPRGPALHGEGPAVEYAVKMRQFPADALGARMIEAGALSLDHARGLGDTVAGFHARAAIARQGTPWAEPESVLGSALENIAHMLRLRLPEQETLKLQALWSWTEARFAGLRETFARRKAEGFVRECHGDLHLANLVMLDGALAPFDGIEFNDALRWTDVAADVAFAVMDFAAHRRGDLGVTFLNAWLEHSGDYGALEPMRFYLVYRALVRAKVALLRRAPDHEEFMRYLGTAQGYARPGAGAVFIMHGLSGSGKTTVAGALARALGAVHVRSDVERKRLAGQPAAARTHSGIGGGIYGEEGTRATYARLATLAAGIAGAGFAVIVDAAFLRHWQRELLRRAARGAQVPFTIVSVRAEERTLRERVKARHAAASDASEADGAVLEHQLAAQDPLFGDELLGTLTLDATATLSGPGWSACVRDLLARSGLAAGAGLIPPA